MTEAQPTSPVRRALERARVGGAVVGAVLALHTLGYVLGAPTAPGWVAAALVLFPSTPLVFAGGPLGALVGVAISALAWGWLIESMRARRRLAVVGAWLALAGASATYLAPRLARGTEAHRDQRCDELFAIAAERARAVLDELRSGGAGSTINGELKEARARGASTSAASRLGGGAPPRPRSWRGGGLEKTPEEASNVARCAARDAGGAVECVVEAVERSNPHFFLEGGATGGEPRLCRVSIRADGERAFVLAQQPRRGAPLRTTAVRLDP